MPQAIPETFSREEWVTPDLARTYLEANTRNRNLRKIYVAQLAQIIASGDFLPCVGSISFNVDGRLIDGQHRLSAIVMADAPVKLIVVRNAPPEAQAVIDTGNRRYNADWLKINGVKNSSLVASTLRMILGYKRSPDHDFRHDISNSQKYGPLTIEQSYYDHPGIDDSVAAAYKFRIMVTESSASFTHYVLGTIDSNARDEFFSKLDTPDQLSANSPIMILRDALLRLKHDPRRLRTRDKANAEIGRIFHAWNLWRKGKTVKTLTVPNPFPKPV